MKEETRVENPSLTALPLWASSLTHQRHTMRALEHKMGCWAECTLQQGYRECCLGTECAPQEVL